LGVFPILSRSETFWLDQDIPEQVGAFYTIEGAAGRLAGKKGKKRGGATAFAPPLEETW
jgi:hypothetical protein